MSLTCICISVITQFVRMHSYESIRIHSYEFIRTRFCNFYGWSGSSRLRCATVKSSRSVKPLSTHPDGGRVPSWIFERSNFQLPVGKICVNVPICVTVQIFRGDRSNRCWDSAIFRFFKMAAAAILYFQNVGRLGVGRVKMVKVRHRAKFRVDRSNRCLDMAIFRFFKMAAAAILDF